MQRHKKGRRVAEYGDFQTPVHLARAVCQLLQRRGVEPAAIVEPTCGVGNFLITSLDHFSRAETALGLDVNSRYIETVRGKLEGHPAARKTRTIAASFFETDWPALLQDLPDPLLVIGNPPWVTNTELGTLGSSNLPKKTNFKNHAGLEALTGKSNFDISEWMLLQIIDWLDGREATMAMLCKTGVARKVLAHAWNHDAQLCESGMFSIDAGATFGASVDACLLVCHFSRTAGSREASVYPGIRAERPGHMIGSRGGDVIADIDAFDSWRHLQGISPYRWRSGIKHDCARVMELIEEGGLWRNGAVVFQLKWHKVEGR